MSLWPSYLLGAELADRLEGLRGVLRATEAEAETIRRLPDAAVAALHEAGLFRLSVPEALGGWEAPPLLEMEVFEGVARHSPAAGWNLFVGSVHTAFPSAYLSDDAVATMFAGPVSPVVAGMMQPAGTARDVDGGMCVDGRFSWGSGISHAPWVLGGVVVRDASGAAVPGFRVFVVRKEQVEVLDNCGRIGQLRLRAPRRLRARGMVVRVPGAAGASRWAALPLAHRRAAGVGPHRVRLGRGRASLRGDRRAGRDQAALADHHDSGRSRRLPTRPGTGVQPPVGRPRPWRSGAGSPR